MNQADLWVDFNSKEIIVFGDYANEEGAYVLKLMDKSNGLVLQEVESRHMHVFRKSEDGRWTTWRMMTNRFRLFIINGGHRHSLE